MKETVLTHDSITVRPVLTATDRAAFIDLPYRLYATNPNWVPPLKSEVRAMIDPKKNTWFGHGEAEYFLAERGGIVVGRISAHIDHLALEQPIQQGMGPGTGNWGMMEAQDEAIFQVLITRAEQALRAKGMHRALGPISLSIWEEPGLLVKGHDHPPTVMMGYHNQAYQGWVERAGYAEAKRLLTHKVKIDDGFPALFNRIVQSGERNARIRVRRVDKARFDEEAAIIMGILNDAWSDNWGFVPLTDMEIAEVGKKLKPIVFEELIRIAEVEGEPVAFIISLPDLNDVLIGLGGSLLPFGWLKLLLWLRKPKTTNLRVPLMGVVKRLQSTRLASQLAIMMIEQVRRDAITTFGVTHGEIGWILEDNQGMLAIADVIGAAVNKEYVIYEKALRD